MPKDEWIFSPCYKPRGCVHNLHLEGRVDLLPRPPMTVQELILGSAEFWPAWDTRTKLNTINTKIATKLSKRKYRRIYNHLRIGKPIE